MPITVSGTQLTFNDATVQTTAAITSREQIRMAIAFRTAVFNSTGSSMVFNSAGSATWTCPTGVTSVYAFVVGGGGGGSNDGANGAVGGPGGYGWGIYTVVPGTAYALTVANGGGGSTGIAGGGGTSSFASFLSCTGGGGAQNPNENSSVAGTATGQNIRGAAAQSFGGGTAYSAFDMRPDWAIGAQIGIAQADTSPCNATATTAFGPGGGGASLRNGGSTGAIFLQWVGA